jgi:hypothetical protein
MGRLRVMKLVLLFGLGFSSLLVRSNGLSHQARAGYCVVCANCNGAACCIGAASGGKSCRAYPDGQCFTLGGTCS